MASEIDETLESAAYRTFIVEVAPKVPARGWLTPQVVVVQARSIYSSRKIAFKKVAKGRFKHLPWSAVTFSIQEVDSNGNTSGNS